MPEPGLPLGLRLFETQQAKWTLASLLGLYAAVFLALYPQGITVGDEGTYIRQAQAVATGTSAIERVDPFTGEVVEFRPLDEYPLGTALMMAPFVAVGGVKGAYFFSLVCLLAAVALTARWLSEQHRSPLWAGLLIAYPPTIVLGRLAMSESASLFLAILGLWLFWQGTSRSSRWFGAAGFVAGASFSVREGNVLLFAPLFLGAVIRRDAGWPALVAGGLVGLGVRLLSSWMYFGDPFFVKTPAGFAFDAALEQGALYLFFLLVLVPGGLIAAFAYRGPRRVEIIATIAIFVSFYFVYGYSGQTSGWAKRLILGPRFFIPLLPLLALTAADVWPRWGAMAVERWSSRRAQLERASGVLATTAVVVVAMAIIGVQWAHATWSQEQATARKAILSHTERGEVIITNWKATGKFIDLAGDGRMILRRKQMGQASIAQLLAQNGSFYVVLLDRSDSDYWRRDAFENATFLKFIKTLRYEPTNLADVQISPTDRLRIWKVVP